MSLDLIEKLKELDPQDAPREDVEELIKGWRTFRDARLEAERKANKIKTTETALKSFLLECFKAQKLEGMIIAGRSTGLSTKTTPAVEDKEKLLAFIKETGALELLQFRLSNGAVEERWAAEQDVPGVQEIEVYDLFDRKA